MAKAMVWNKFWRTFTSGLSDTRDTLLGTNDNDNHDNIDDQEPTSFLQADQYTTNTQQQESTTTTTKRNNSWKYRDAWKVLQHKLRETRQETADGVQAFRQHVQLCDAVVGPPGLIPIQYMLDRLLPYNIQANLQQALEQALVEMDFPAATAGGIQKVTLSHFSVGKAAPKLEAARLYDVGPNAMAMECDVTWDSINNNNNQLEANVHVHPKGLPRIPVTVHNVQFRGPVRIVLAPLTQDSPNGFGAALVSFPSMPDISLDVAVAGGAVDITKLVPRVRSELIVGIQKAIAETMIWPKRSVIPSTNPHNNNQNVLSQRQLQELEYTDPLLQAEESAKWNSRPLLRSKLNRLSTGLDHDKAAALETPAVTLPTPSFARTLSSESSTPASTAPSTTSHQHNPLSLLQLQNSVYWADRQRCRTSPC